MLTVICPKNRKRGNIFLECMCNFFLKMSVSLCWIQPWEHHRDRELQKDREKAEEVKRETLGTSVGKRLGILYQTWKKKRSKSEMEMVRGKKWHTHKHTKTKTRVQLPFYSNDTTCFFFNIELKASLFNLLNILDCGEQISTFLPSTCRVSSWRQAALPKGKNSKSQLNFTKKEVCIRKQR